MKTKAQVLRDNPQHAKLIRAVLKRIAKEEIAKINKYGMRYEYGDFVHNAYTHKFAMRYRKSIIPMLEEAAGMLSGDVVTMVSHFRVYRKRGMSADDRRDLYLYLGYGRPKDVHLTNLMTWFAAEEVCRMFED